MSGLLDATTPDADVVAALRSDAGSYTWVAAAVGSQNAAGLQLASQQPVMAIGGFNGSDPSPTLAQFQQDVSEGRIHYFLQGGGFGGQNGGSSSSSEISTWVEQTFTRVSIGGQTFYDLTQPAAGASS
jgi:4-amino-4-deoxy-L-arabinose transferase-like glycosyltransferase